ncbi:MAG: hypothetical protein IJB63_09725 [Alistipes sp.]|nr:hypothetical protein [Alistipes sp.]
MIKKIIGVLATLATLAVILFAALNFGNYTSLLPEDLFSSQAVTEAVEEVVPDADTTTPAESESADVSGGEE